MSILGISSANSYASAFSVYETSQVSYVRSKQDSSDAQKVEEKSSQDDIKDEAIISDEAKLMLENDKGNTEETQTEDNVADSEESDDTQKNVANKEEDLSPDQKQQLAELEARDAEVKTHEAAHKAAAAGLNASAPSYDYETGPDGKRYAVGGEVNISFTQSSNPEENITNAERMKAAALAPAEPSAQDRAVASDASRIIMMAKQELRQQQTEETPEEDDTDNTEAKTTEKAETTSTQQSAVDTTLALVENTTANTIVNPTKRTIA